MIFGTPDLRVICRDTGVPVVFNGVSAYADTGEQIKGLLDQPMDMKLGGGGFGGVDLEFPALRLPYNAFDPSPTDQDEISVDGTEYVVSSVGADDDGAFMVLGLRFA